MALPGSVAGEGELVADGGVALQQFPAFIAEPAADPSCVRLEVVQFLDVAGFPDVLEDHPAGANLPGVAGEVAKEVEFSGGEVQGSAAQGRLIVD